MYPRAELTPQHQKSPLAVMASGLFVLACQLILVRTWRQGLWHSEQTPRPASGASQQSERYSRIMPGVMALVVSLGAGVEGVGVGAEVGVEVTRRKIRS